MTCTNPTTIQRKRRDTACTNMFRNKSCVDSFRRARVSRKPIRRFLCNNSAVHMAENLKCIFKTRDVMKTTKRIQPCSRLVNQHTDGRVEHTVFTGRCLFDIFVPNLSYTCPDWLEMIIAGLRTSHQLSHETLYHLCKALGAG